jgi:hypothetical protein
MERRDADAKLSAEVGDGQVGLGLSLDLPAPPVEPRLEFRRWKGIAGPDLHSLHVRNDWPHPHPRPRRAVRDEIEYSLWRLADSPMPEIRIASLHMG